MYTLSEYNSEKEDSVMHKLFVKANLSCGQRVEFSFYVYKIYKPVCIDCGCTDDFWNEV